VREHLYSRLLPSSRRADRRWPKATCTAHCLSTCQHTLGHAYNVSDGLRGLGRQAVNGLPRRDREFLRRRAEGRWNGVLGSGSGHTAPGPDVDRHPSIHAPGAHSIVGRRSECVLRAAAIDAVAGVLVLAERFPARDAVLPSAARVVQPGDADGITFL
jgi:hypothetical protein